MYRSSDFNKDSYKTGEAAKILNVTNGTIANYDKAGKLKVNRTETNRRVIFKDDLLDYLKNLNLLIEDNLGKVDILYARVSSHEQKKKGVTIIVMKEEKKQ